MILATCGVVFAFPSDQRHTPAQPEFLLFAAIGLGLLIGPLVNYFNAEVTLEKGVISKRGPLRTTRRWAVSEIVAVDLRARNQADGVAYAKYQFMRRDNVIAFELSQSWWRVSDIDALIAALGLPGPATGTRSYQ